MSAHEQMRLGARIMAATFGGPGIFYVYLSFLRPDVAVTAVIYLALAVVLSIAASEPTKVPARARAFFTKKRR